MVKFSTQQIVERDNVSVKWENLIETLSKISSSDCCNWKCWMEYVIKIFNNRQCASLQNEFIPALYSTSSFEWSISCYLFVSSLVSLYSNADKNLIWPSDSANSLKHTATGNVATCVLNKLTIKLYLSNAAASHFQ